MEPKIVNLNSAKNDVWGVVNSINEMAKNGEIEEIMVIWKTRNGGMLHKHSDLSSLLFLGMMKLVADDISEYRRDE